MIYLEDYDLPVIVLNVNAFLSAFVFIITGWFSEIISVTATGDADIFGFGSAMLYITATLFFEILVVFTAMVDLWWVLKKTRDNRRWL